MIFVEQAIDYVNKMSWPEGAKKPWVQFWHTDRGFVCLLHHRLTDGWKDVARTVACTPEAALRGALEEWVVRKGLNNQPKLFAEIKRLTN